MVASNPANRNSLGRAPQPPASSRSRVVSGGRAAATKSQIGEKSALSPRASSALSNLSERDAIEVQKVQLYNSQKGLLKKSLKELDTARSSLLSQQKIWDCIASCGFPLSESTFQRCIGAFLDSKAGGDMVKYNDFLEALEFSRNSNAINVRTPAGWSGPSLGRGTTPPPRSRPSSSLSVRNGGEKVTMIKEKGLSRGDAEIRIGLLQALVSGLSMGVGNTVKKTELDASLSCVDLGVSMADVQAVIAEVAGSGSRIAVSEFMGRMIDLIQSKVAVEPNNRPGSAASVRRPSSAASTARPSSVLSGRTREKQQNEFVWLRECLKKKVFEKNDHIKVFFTRHGTHVHGEWCLNKSTFVQLFREHMEVAASEAAIHALFDALDVSGEGWINYMQIERALHPMNENPLAPERPSRHVDPKYIFSGRRGFINEAQHLLNKKHPRESVPGGIQLQQDTLDAAELLKRKIMQKLYEKTLKAATVFRLVDSNRNGTLELREFINFVRLFFFTEGNDVIETLFNRLAGPGERYLSYEKFATALKYLDTQQIDHFLSYDPNEHMVISQGRCYYTDNVAVKPRRPPTNVRKNINPLKSLSREMQSMIIGEHGKLQRDFKKLDPLGTGFVSKEKLRSVVKSQSLGLHDNELNFILDQCKTQESRDGEQLLAYADLLSVLQSDDLKLPKAHFRPNQKVPIKDQAVPQPTQHVMARNLGVLDVDERALAKKVEMISYNNPLGASFINPPFGVEGDGDLNVLSFAERIISKFAHIHSECKKRDFANSKSISHDAFRRVMSDMQLNLTKSELDQLMRVLDPELSGQIKYELLITQHFNASLKMPYFMTSRSYRSSGNPIAHDEPVRLSENMKILQGSAGNYINDNLAPWPKKAQDALASKMEPTIETVREFERTSSIATVSTATMRGHTPQERSENVLVNPSPLGKTKPLFYKNVPYAKDDSYAFGKPSALKQENISNIVQGAYAMPSGAMTDRSTGRRRKSSWIAGGATRATSLRNAAISRHRMSQENRRLGSARSSATGTPLQVTEAISTKM